jgi:hypothetical protein
MVVVQELSDRDLANCRTVAERLIGILSDDLIILMTYEAPFHLSGCVNKQNTRCWAEENPQQLHHSAPVTVWRGVENLGVAGPNFFEDEDGRASACYFKMLRNLHQN